MGTLKVVEPAKKTEVEALIGSHRAGGEGNGYKTRL